MTQNVLELAIPRIWEDFAKPISSSYGLKWIRCCLADSKVDSFFLEEDTLVLLKEISFSDQVKRTNGLWQEARVCSKRLSHMHIGQTQSKKCENECIPKWDKQLCKI